MSATVHLVDASVYVFRAYFSPGPDFTDPQGNPVKAVRGFGDMLWRLIREQEVTHLGVAFDGSLTTSFRNDFYPPYKAQRELPPADLEAQLESCRELAGALGAPTFIDERFEADDLIATIAEGLGDTHVVVVTTDKDLGQLVDASTSLLDFAKGDRYGPAEIEAKFGVRPDQVPDFLGIAGDKVDNIPGVKGIGAKGAAALLGAFGTLEEVYARLDDVAELSVRGAKSMQAKLAADRENALLSKRLATVARDAPVSAGLDALRYDGPDLDRLEPLCERLGLGGLWRRVSA